MCEALLLLLFRRTLLLRLLGFPLGRSLRAVLVRGVTAAAGHRGALFDELVHGVDVFGKVLPVGHHARIFADFVQALGSHAFHGPPHHRVMLQH